MKKLYGQLTEDEKLMLDNILKNIDTQNTYIVFHAKQRMKQKNIKFRDVFSVFSNYEIIEVNIPKEDDVRVLLRSKKATQGNNICISYGLNNNVVITAYKNSSQDKHRTLIYENYCDFNVMQHLIKLQNKLNKSVDRLDYMM